LKVNQVSLFYSAVVRQHRAYVSAILDRLSASVRTIDRVVWEISFSG